MRVSGLWALVRLGLRKDVRGAGSSIFGVAVGVSALVFFAALGLGVERLLKTRVFPVEAALVDVVMPRVSLGKLWGNNALDEALAQRLAALPGVRRVYRKMAVRVPSVSHYDGAFFGAPLRMGLELVVIGVEPGYIEKDLGGAPFDDSTTDAPLPAVASQRLLDVYNASFAPSRGLPQLSGALLRGFTFPVEFNRSMVVAGTRGEVRRGSLELRGVSERGALMGVYVPLATARRLNAAFGQDADNYSGLVLEAEGPGAVPALVAAVNAMGLRVDESEQRLASQVGGAVAAVTLLLTFVSLLVCLLAAVNIAHAIDSAVRRRQKDFAVMRAVGASGRQIRGLIGAEAVVLGTLGSVAGVGLALAAAVPVRQWAASAMPAFSDAMGGLFVFPPWLVLGAVGLGVGAAAVGSYWPGRHAARVDVAQSLSGS